MKVFLLDNPVCRTINLCVRLVYGGSQFTYSKEVLKPYKCMYWQVCSSFKYIFLLLFVVKVYEYMKVLVSHSQTVKRTWCFIC